MLKEHLDSPDEAVGFHGGVLKENKLKAYNIAYSLFQNFAQWMNIDFNDLIYGEHTYVNTTSALQRLWRRVYNISDQIKYWYYAQENYLPYFCYQLSQTLHTIFKYIYYKMVLKVIETEAYPPEHPTLTDFQHYAKKLEKHVLTIADHIQIIDIYKKYPNLPLMIWRLYVEIKEEEPSQNNIQDDYLIEAYNKDIRHIAKNNNNNNTKTTNKTKQTLLKDAFIYAITIGTEIVYVGMTQHPLHQRIGYHIQAALIPDDNPQQNYLYKAMREHPYQFQLLYESHDKITSYELQTKEKEYIEKLDPKFNVEGRIRPYVYKEYK